MTGMLELTMEELISTQLLIGSTFDRMQHLIDNNLGELRELREIYSQKSIDALELFWKYFNDNNYLLIKAQVKDGKYFTDKMYDKVKEEYLSVMPVLRQYAEAEFPDTDSSSNLKILSQRDLHVHHQRLRFNTIHKEIKGIQIDHIKEIEKMEAWQKILKQQWIIIEKCHKTIREKFPGMWPDLPYELDYVQYKNMYETTYSRLNYKIDAAKLDRILHPFAVSSVAWARIQGLSQVISNAEALDNNVPDY